MTARRRASAADVDADRLDAAAMAQALSLPDDDEEAEAPASRAPAQMPMADDPLEILVIEDRPIIEVDVPEWGRRVRVRALSGRERDLFDMQTFQITQQNIAARAAGKEVSTNVRARLVAATVRRADGETPLFTVDQVVALGEKNGNALDRLFTVARAESRIGWDAETSDEAVEQAVADLKADPTDSSASD